MIFIQQVREFASNKRDNNQEEDKKKWKDGIHGSFLYYKTQSKEVSNALFTEL